MASSEAIWKVEEEEEDWERAKEGAKIHQKYFAKK